MRSAAARCAAARRRRRILSALTLARTLVALEQLSDTLFIAILIARLAGIYAAKTDE